MVLDGEIVALGGDGRPSFNALQKRAQLKTPKEIAAAQRETPVAMVCFDLLHFAGLNLRGAPYTDRRRYLVPMSAADRAHLQLMHTSEDAETLYAAAIDSGFEGIVAKRKDSTYQPGKRSPGLAQDQGDSHRGVRRRRVHERQGGARGVGALLLGYWEGEDLHYVGHVGSGLTDGSIKDLRARFAIS